MNTVTFMAALNSMRYMGEHMRPESWPDDGFFRWDEPLHEYQFGRIAPSGNFVEIVRSLYCDIFTTTDWIVVNGIEEEETLSTTEYVPKKGTGDMGMYTFDEAMVVLRNEGGSIARLDWKGCCIGLDSGNNLTEYTVPTNGQGMYSSDCVHVCLDDINAKDWTIVKPFVSERKKHIIHIAQLCHEMNRGYCKSLGEENIAPKWSEISDEMKDSAITGVEFYFTNLVVSAEELHKSWINHKCQHGWVYGEIKSEADKTHPCIVPYHDLPETQKFKDYLFRSVCVMNAHLINN